VIQVLSNRHVAYTLDICGTTFSADAYVDLITLLLADRFAVRVALRGCKHSVASWVHREAFGLLNRKLPLGFTDDQLPLTAGDSSPEEQRAFAGTLVQDWILRCKVRGRLLHVCITAAWFQKDYCHSCFVGVCCHPYGWLA
jgi:hypothetical protein